MVFLYSKINHAHAEHDILWNGTEHLYNLLQKFNWLVDIWFEMASSSSFHVFYIIKRVGGYHAPLLYYNATLINIIIKKKKLCVV